MRSEASSISERLERLIGKSSSKTRSAKLRYYWSIRPSRSKVRKVGIEKPWLSAKLRCDSTPRYAEVRNPKLWSRIQEFGDSTPEAVESTHRFGGSTPDASVIDPLVRNRVCGISRGGIEVRKHRERNRSAELSRGGIEVRKHREQNRMCGIRQDRRSKV